ncbi:hypothetical protein ACFXJ8_25950 [Nonomuraea sp. NPDC059194]|uniref:hypothetical protein n=1 Tax=Nonomuraea sp. NPDC059194 TaxID=3346764 RepID=UPI0036889AF5
MSTDEPTLGEVARTLERFERTTNARFADLATSISLMITRDLYEAHRTALLEDIGQLREEMKADRDDLKREQDRRTQDRRMVVSALIAAALAVLVGILNVALKNGIGG